MNYEECRKHVPLILRVFLGLTVLFWGYEKLTLEKLVGSYQMDYGGFMVISPGTFLLLFGVVQLLMGVALIIGLYTRVAAALLAVMCIVTIIVPGVIIMGDVPHFAYAFAAAGGSIALFILGSGSLSVDERLAGGEGAAQ